MSMHGFLFTDPVDCNIEKGPCLTNYPLKINTLLYPDYMVNVATKVGIAGGACSFGRHCAGSVPYKPGAVKLPDAAHDLGT